jgi:glycosyltransferase involved in cell wall biosynthesis
MTVVFSIAMPAYNTGKTIDAAIESVLRQTRGDFELIVVDDGSTDDTVARVERYLGDARISLVRQSNAGPSAARNTAIAQAVGEYVSFLDSDDLWLPRYLEVMGATLEANPRAAAAFTDAWVLNDEIKRIARSTVMAPWQPPTIPTEPSMFLRALLEYGNFVYNAVTVKRSVLAEVGGLREALSACVDYELWLRIAAAGYSFVRCPENLAVYRRSVAGQITSDPTTIIRLRPEVFRLVAEEYSVPEDVRALARQLLREHEQHAAEEPPRERRRDHPVIRTLYRPFWLVRWFYLRPPAEVRDAFPKLDNV